MFAIITQRDIGLDKDKGDLAGGGDLRMIHTVLILKV